MELVKRISRMREIVRDARRQDRAIGFVPTMGSLHEGHQSLLRSARDMADCVIMSLFVNPLQFGPDEDYDSYPRDTHRDAEIAKKEGVDYVFMPESKEMYPPGACTRVSVEGVEDRLCGRSRPGHFRGVATVVAKLLSVVQPRFAFFGEKDAQQLVVIRRMVRDLGLDVEIVSCPTLREMDGLALSSRNIYLSTEERKAATVLFRALERARAMFEEDGVRATQSLMDAMAEVLAGEELVQVEYAEVVDAETLGTLEVVDSVALCAIAAHIGSTRLIDNVTLGGGRRG